MVNTVAQAKPTPTRSHPPALIAHLLTYRLESAYRI
jgi:hypothetical protein